MGRALPAAVSTYYLRSARLAFHRLIRDALNSNPKARPCLRHTFTNSTLGSTLLAIHYISTAVVLLGGLSVLINIGILVWFLWRLHF